MRRSGIIYPSENNITLLFEELQLVGEKYPENESDFYSFYDQESFSSRKKVDVGKEREDIQKDRKTENLADIFRLKDNSSRKFSSSVNFLKGSDKDSSSKNSSFGELLTFRQLGLRNKSQEIKESMGLRRNLTGNRNSSFAFKNTEGSYKEDNSVGSDLKVKKPSKTLSLSFRKRKKVEENDDVLRNERPESAILNFMFIFEIFRFLGSSDIIVRLVIGAIAGLVGFGYIFSSMGLFENL